MLGRCGCRDQRRKLQRGRIKSYIPPRTGRAACADFLRAAPRCIFECRISVGLRGREIGGSRNASEFPEEYNFERGGQPVDLLHRHDISYSIGPMARTSGVRFGGFLRKLEFLVNLSPGGSESQWRNRRNPSLPNVGWLCESNDSGRGCEKCRSNAESHIGQEHQIRYCE